MEDGYSELKPDTPNKKMDHYPNITRYKIVFCKHVTLLSYTQVHVKLVGKISVIFYTYSKSFL